MNTPPIQRTVVTSGPTTEAVPVAPTVAVTVPAIPHAATPQQHASRWHSILAALEGLLAVGTSPAVMALLPPKYQGYVAAASVVEQVTAAATDTTTPEGS